MTHFAAAREALDEARAALAALRRPGNDLEMVKKTWAAFLHDLERCWNKTRAEMKPIKKWQGWPGRGEIERLRESDPTLAYLVHARGQHEHGLDPISWRMDILRILRADERAEDYIARVQGIGGKISQQANVHDMVRGVRRICAVTQKGQMRLGNVTNRGRIYKVPETHRGKPLLDIDPISVGAAGIEFYSATLDHIESVFFPKGA